MVASKDL